MITVNDRWVIQVDPNNYIVCQNKPKTDKRTGKVSYDAEGYFRSLSDALEYISDEEVRISLSDGDKTLPEAVSTVARVRNEMSALLRQILEHGGTK